MNYYILDNTKKIKTADIRIFTTIDLAVSTKESSDYTVILTFAISSETDILILDIVREKFETLKHTEVVIDNYNRWHPLLIGIESVQYQISLVNELMQHGLPVKALKPNKDKLSRSLSMQSKLENGKVFFPKYAAWLSVFEAELLNFPNGKNDDQIDCFAIYFKHIGTNF